MSELEDRTREAMHRMAEEVHPRLSLPAQVRRRARRRQRLTAAGTGALLVVVVAAGVAGVEASRPNPGRPHVHTGPVAAPPTSSVPPGQPSITAASAGGLPATCTSGWIVAARPSSPGVQDSLVAASAAAYDDVWAVGTRYLGAVVTAALIEHWDGHRWAVVPGADLGGRWATLAGVDALAPGDVWAVGTLKGASIADPRQDPLIEHWNGRQWSRVAGAPATSGVSPRLVAVAAGGPDDVWLLGHDSPAAGGVSMSRDLYEHWDGTRWSLDEGPLPAGSAVRVQATQTLSVDHSGDAWAAGGKVNGSGAAGQPAGSLVERWNGSTWVEVPAPAGTSAVGALAVVGPNDVWAVTSDSLVTGGGTYGTAGRPQFAHWVGSGWTASTPAGGVSGVVARGPTDVWAAGRSTLIMHWDGRSWRTLDTHPPVAAIVGVDSLSVAADGTVVGFSTDPAPAPAGQAGPPPPARSYLWLECR